MSRRFQPAIIPLLALLFTGCNGDDPAPTETEEAPGLAIVSGNAQSGVAGEELPDPLIVRVTTESGEPVADASVIWSVTTGGGSVAPTPVRTDTDGRAEADWRLGGALGEQIARATVDAGSITFRATAADTRVPATLVAIGGENQVGTTGAQLVNPLIVRVENEFGRPVAGVEVEWSVESGGGTVSPSSTTTDTDGRAQAQWTLGFTVGNQFATATANGITARVRATARQ